VLEVLAMSFSFISEKIQMLLRTITAAVITTTECKISWEGQMP